MQVVASDDVKWMDVLKDDGRVRVGVYMGSPGKMADGPEAFMTCLLDGATIQPHFHDVDQFQVFLGGAGVIGRRRAAPITVQYADAFGPYGPIVANDAGLEYLVLRAAAAGGHFEMPERASLIPGKLGRTFSYHLNQMPHLLGRDSAATKLLDAQSDGLMMEERYLSSGATEHIGNGGCAQFIVVCEGLVTVSGRSLTDRSVVFLGREDSSVTAVAGGCGVRLLLLRFPGPSQRVGSDPASVSERASDRKYDLPESYKAH